MFVASGLYFLLGIMLMATALLKITSVDLLNDHFSEMKKIVESERDIIRDEEDAQGVPPK